VFPQKAAGKHQNKLLAKESAIEFVLTSSCARIIRSAFTCTCLWLTAG